MISQHPSGWRGMRTGLLGAVLAMVLTAALAPIPAAQAARPAQEGPRGTIPHTAVDPYGANVFLHKEVEQAKVTRTLDLAKGANLAWIKQDFPWNDIEIDKKGDFTDRRNPPDKSAWDKYDFIVDQAEQRGLQVVGRVSFAPDWARPPQSGANDAPTNYADLADFVVALLDHFSGRLKYIQVWNEPNLAREWKQGGRVAPAAYVDMLKTVYTRVKQTHPDVTVLSAPMAITLENIDYAGNLNELDYWDQMYKAGAKDYFDVLSANAYGLDLPPTDPPAPDKLNFRRVELLRDVMVKNGDANKAIWFNEYGWNASPTTISEQEQLLWRRVDPATQAQWTTEGIQYALDHWPWAGVFFIWYFRQVGDIPPDKAEYYFRMVDPDFSIQQIYKDVRHAAGLYKGPGAPPTSTAAPGTTVPGPTAAGATPPGATPTLSSVLTPTVGPAIVTPLTTGTVVATPVVPPAAAGSEGPNLIWFVVGGLLIFAGAGAIGYYMMRRPTP